MGGRRPVADLDGQAIGRCYARGERRGVGNVVRPDALHDVRLEPPLLGETAADLGMRGPETSALHEIQRPDLNIQTAEDPIEYTLPGVNQMQVNREIGLTFQRALRSDLRQYPDVILVGEIRDLETAEIAVEAALT